MNHAEPARTGTNALGRRSQTAARSGRGDGGTPTPAASKLVIVDPVAQHNEQPHEQLASDGDFGFGSSASMHEREVRSLEVDIHPPRMRGGLTENVAEQGAPLLGDVAEVILVGGGGHRGGEAHVADDRFGAVVRSGLAPTAN